MLRVSSPLPCARARRGRVRHRRAVARAGRVNAWEWERSGGRPVDGQPVSRCARPGGRTLQLASLA
jgi:hypothetical protein